MIQNHVADLVQILAGHGVAHAVLAPGSRSAPLALAFERYTGIALHVVADERVAGYTALGIAAATGLPVAVVVTSGTAVLNLAPAVAEATLAQIPLLLLTADRPPEAAGQQDGQMVYQANAFGQNAKAAFVLPVVESGADLRLTHRLLNEACLAATTPPYGPVQVNIPFAVPFYPAPGQDYDFARPVPVWHQALAPPLLTRPQLTELQAAWQNARQRMVVVGTQPHNLDIANALSALLYYAPDVLLCADPTSNVAHLAGHNVPLLADFNKLETLAMPPEDVLILHLGGSLTSRKLRQWLRTLPGQVWRIQPYASPAPDPFYKLNKIIVADPAAFITKLGEHAFFENDPKPALPAPDVQVAAAILATQPVEAHLAQTVLASAPETCVVHLSSSMPVRWAQWFWQPTQHQHVWCNRGASGIDGCTSTAVGYARTTDRPVLLLTGDTAFFYDRNALWAAEPLPPNLKIVVLNNGGGHIFGRIDGPRGHAELERLFINPHNLSAKSAADDFGLAYFSTHALTAEILAQTLWQQSGPALLEIFCKPEPSGL